MSSSPLSQSAAAPPRLPLRERLGFAIGDFGLNLYWQGLGLFLIFFYTDGFTEAFYGRPEAFLDPDVRAAQSAWQFADPSAIAAGLDRLAADLSTGVWDARLGFLRTRPTFTGAVRLVVGRP